MQKRFVVFLCLPILFLSCAVHRPQGATIELTALPSTPEKVELPAQLNEISGLLNVAQDFYGFNDSGGKPEVYRFNADNPSEIKQTLHLKNAKNRDWESLAESDTHIFVGDFGNNRGNRKDLTIYYFEKRKIKPSVAYQEIQVDSLRFYYPEQQNFSNQAYAHNFDCEAMVYAQGKLHLFTKEWARNQTRHYTLDLVKGNQPAWLVETFATQFLVTGADVQQTATQNQLALVGYTRKGQAYLLKTSFSKTSPLFLQNKKNVYPLGFAGKVGQVEGVAFVPPHTLCYSAEDFKKFFFHQKQNLSCMDKF